MIKFDNNQIDFIKYLNDIISEIQTDGKEYIATIEVNTTNGKTTHLNLNINRDYRGFKEYEEYDD